jgi:hypothetical protein
MYIASHPSTGDNELTDDDLDNICAFSLCMSGSGIPRSTYNNLHQFFRRKLKLDTEYLMCWHMEFLSGIKPEFYDMCENSCLLYVDTYEDEIYCQGWYEGLSMIDQLKYRSRHTHMPGEYHNVFDGSHYRGLLDTHVEVRGETLGHKYFSDPRDIALGGSTDGFQVIAK